MIKNIFTFISCFFAIWNLKAQDTDNGFGKLQPSPLMKHETKWLVQALEQAHFNKVSIGDLNETFFINSYLKKLDPELYFTKHEVEEFKKNFSSTVVTYFTQGNLFPAFEIFNRYQTNALSLLDSALLKIENSISMESNRSYHFDRSKTDWDQSTEDLDYSWNRLIHHEILNEVISSIDSNITVDDLNSSLLKIVSDARKL